MLIRDNVQKQTHDRIDCDHGHNHGTDLPDDYLPLPSRIRQTRGNGVGRGSKSWLVFITSRAWRTFRTHGTHSFTLPSLPSSLVFCRIFKDLVCLSNVLRSPDSGRDPWNKFIRISAVNFRAFSWNSKSESHESFQENFKQKSKRANVQLFCTCCKREKEKERKRRWGRRETDRCPKEHLKWARE